VKMKMMLLLFFFFSVADVIRLFILLHYPLFYYTILLHSPFSVVFFDISFCCLYFWSSSILLSLR